MKRCVDLGRRFLDIFKKKDQSKENDKGYIDSIFYHHTLEEKLMEIWEAMRPRFEKAMGAGKTAMEDPRAKKVAVGSAVLALSFVCYWSLSGSKDQPVKEIRRIIPRPKAVPKPIPQRIVRPVQWPVSMLIKQSPHTP